MPNLKPKFIPAFENTKDPIIKNAQTVFTDFMNQLEDTGEFNIDLLSKLENSLSVDKKKFPNAQKLKEQIYLQVIAILDQLESDKEKKIQSIKEEMSSRGLGTVLYKLDSTLALIKNNYSEAFNDLKKYIDPTLFNSTSIKPDEIRSKAADFINLTYY